VRAGHVYWEEANITTILLSVDRGEEGHWLHGVSGALPEQKAKSG
jgi:hypothetical protein